VRCVRCKQEYLRQTGGGCPQCGSVYAVASSAVISRSDHEQALPRRTSSAATRVYIGSSVGSVIGSWIGWTIGHGVSGFGTTSRGNIQFTDEGEIVGFWASILLALIGALIGSLVSYLKSQREKGSIWLRVLIFVGGTTTGWVTAVFVLAFAAGNN
jgi:hypothetical protein